MAWLEAAGLRHFYGIGVRKIHAEPCIGFALGCGCPLHLEFEQAAWPQQSVDLASVAVNHFPAWDVLKNDIRKCERQGRSAI